MFVVPVRRYTILSSSFSNDAVRVSSWIHRWRRAPPRTTATSPKMCSPSSPSLGRVFMDAAVMGEAESTKRSTTRRPKRSRPDTDALPPWLEVNNTTTASHEPARTAKRFTPKGTKNPLKANERLACYRLRLQTTPEQHHALKKWMEAGRWAYNRMLDYVHTDPPQAGGTLPMSFPTDSLINELCKATRNDPQHEGIHRCVFRNAMLDVRTALKGERTKRERCRSSHDPGGNGRGNLRKRSPRRTSTEVIGLDAAVFRPDDVEGLGAPKDTGPVRFIERCTTVERGPKPPNRRWAAVHFGCDLKAVSPVRMRGRRWLIDRLVDERYLRHQGKLLWDKRLDAFYLIVTLRQQRPPDPDPTHAHKRVVAMDPGVRNFQTFVDMENGSHGTLLDGYAAVSKGCDPKPTMVELVQRKHRIDRLQAKLQAIKTRTQRHENHPSRTIHQTLRHTQRLAARCHVHLNHFKTDMHYAACTFLWNEWSPDVDRCHPSGSLT